MVGILAEYISRADLAHELRCTEKTLQRYERMPDGLPHLTIAGRRYYKIDAVRSWIAKRERKPNPRRAA